MNTQDKLLYESTEVWNQILQTGQKNLAQAIIDFFPEEVITALDVGCGDGKLTESIIKTTKVPIVGLDFSEEALSRCTFKTTLGDATSLPFKDSEFDLVLTTDMLEHLPSSIEEKVWEQLFRVAKKWVFVAVPFREELLYATAKCHHCSHQYHVNWHMRSYDWPELVSRCPDSFEVDKIILTGESYSPYHALETSFRREILDEWSGWRDAVCPCCDKSGASPDPVEPLPSLTASALGNMIYSDRLTRPDFSSHSEILVLYRHRSVCKTKKKPVIESTLTHSQTNEIILDEMTIGANLIPYPSVARAVHATDEGLILQFPAYAPYDSLEIKTTRNKQDVPLSVEDGFGILFSGELNIVSKGRYVLALPRNTKPSYYGLLVRIKSPLFIKSIQLGDNRPIGILRSLTASPSYYVTQSNQISTYIQVTTACYLDKINLTPVSSKHPDWRCLFEKIEVLAQEERNRLQAQTQNLIMERDKLQMQNYQLLNHFEVRIRNEFHKTLKEIKRIFKK